MRGKALNTSFVPELYRITPAYAGKSSELKESASIRRDHPRICGEKCVRYLCEMLLRGITPAYAGKSGEVEIENLTLKDHPRICGEKYMNMMNEQREKGSPPHMRGKGIKWCAHAHQTV